MEAAFLPWDPASRDQQRGAASVLAYLEGYLAEMPATPQRVDDLRDLVARLRADAEGK